MNHFIYADDICAFAHSGLQKLIIICGNFGKENFITFNSMKSVISKCSDDIKNELFKS